MSTSSRPACFVMIRVMLRRYGKALGFALSLMVAAATRSFLRSVSGELPCAILFAHFPGGSHGPDRK